MYVDCLRRHATVHSDTGVVLVHCFHSTYGPHSLVLAVLGPVHPDELGVTLAHEHVLFKYEDIFYKEPDHTYSTNDLINLSMTIENFGKIRRYP